MPQRPLSEERLETGVTFERFSRYLFNEEGHEYSGDVPPALFALADATTIQNFINQAIFDIVDEARNEGASWQEIGDVLGISRQAAWERFAE